MMRFHVRYVSACILAAGLAASFQLFGQSINQLDAIPSPACVGEAMTYVVDGTGSCTNTVVSPGSGLPDLPAQSGTLPLQFLLPGGYTSAGTAQVSVKSDDCAVSLPGNAITLQVESCRPQAGHAPDGTIKPRTEMTAAVVDIADGLTRLNPVITQGPIGGPVQPGNDNAFIILGYYFPRPGENGRVILVGPWGIEPLEVQAWNGDGSGVSVKVPDTISGHVDQPALIVVQTASGISSNWLEVDFVAARETRTLVRSEVELLSCSTSSDVDCCNDFYDADVIQWFCLGDSNASFSGFHMTQWGMPRDDLGIDSYKVVLKNDWVINTILMDVQQEEGESSARSITPGAQGNSTWTEEIAWVTSPNDEVFYRGIISIIGPRGVPHQ